MYSKFGNCKDNLEHIYIISVVYGLAPANEVANASKSGPLVVIAVKCTTTLFARVVEIRPMGEDGDQAAAARVWGDHSMVGTPLHNQVDSLGDHLARTDQTDDGWDGTTWMIICISSISRNTQVFKHLLCSKE